MCLLHTSSETRARFFYSFLEEASKKLLVNDSQKSVSAGVATHHRNSHRSPEGQAETRLVDRNIAALEKKRDYLASTVDVAIEAGRQHLEKEIWAVDRLIEFHAVKKKNVLGFSRFEDDDGSHLEEARPDAHLYYDDEDSDD
ncbi:hypothetical protein E8E11_007901 [Didymella keratinophila]|nr:hypothetical protein E8E11_007901 [Didymella keratinophila]